MALAEEMGIFKGYELGKGEDGVVRFDGVCD